MRQAARHAAVLLLLFAPVSLVACDDDDEDPVVLEAACSSTITGAAGPRVFLDCGTVTGSLVTVDLWAADITDEFDGYSILLTFDPAVFRYTGFVSSAEPFAPDCDDSGLQCMDNAGSANDTGLVSYTVQLFPGNPDPAGVTVGAAERLGQLMFQTVAASSTAVRFDNPVTAGGCDPSGGTTLFEFNPNCLLFGFEALDGISYEDSSLTLSATSP